MTTAYPTPEELPALTAFLVQITTWHSLHLKLIVNQKTEGGSSCWETLEKLEIEAYASFEEPVRLRFAKIAPNLRELRISLGHIPDAYQLVEGFVNPKKLRHLHIDADIYWRDGILPTFYYHTLAQAANLESLRILDWHGGPGLFGFSFSETVSSFPVSNLNLTTLAVHDNRATKDCLQNLSLPSLTSLTFITVADGYNRWSPSLPVVVERIIAQSDCKIKHVRLEGTPKAYPIALSLIQLLTTVECLELLPSNDMRYLPQLLEMMSHETWKRTDPLILPNLTSLSVGCPGPMVSKLTVTFVGFVEHPWRWSNAVSKDAAANPGESWKLSTGCAFLENAHLFCRDTTSISMEYARGRRGG